MTQRQYTSIMTALNHICREMSLALSTIEGNDKTEKAFHLLRAYRNRFYHRQYNINEAERALTECNGNSWQLDNRSF